MTERMGYCEKCHIAGIVEYEPGEEGIAFCPMCNEVTKFISLDAGITCPTEIPRAKKQDNILKDKFGHPIRKIDLED